MAHVEISKFPPYHLVRCFHLLSYSNCNNYPFSVFLLTLTSYVNVFNVLHYTLSCATFTEIAQPYFFISMYKLEFLAPKWAVVDKLRGYLYGATFVVKTDNNPLTYLLSSAKLDATGHRWLATLSEFQFSSKYWPGVGNRDADALC